MKIKQPGFTIVELLVIIIVVAILAAIAIVGYNFVVYEAKKTQVIAGIKDIEKALAAKSIRDKSNGWVKDSDLVSAMVGATSSDTTSHGNPYIKSLIEKSDFSKYLPSLPGGDMYVWDYDNDGGTADWSCTTTAHSWVGANITVKPLTKEMILDIDRTIDDGDPGCGKVRWAGGTSNYIFYKLGDRP